MLYESTDIGGYNHQIHRDKKENVGYQGEVGAWTVMV